MSDYTLATELVRRDYCLEYGSYYPERAREFDRWLTEHDREKRIETLKWAQQVFAGEDSVGWCRQAAMTAHGANAMGLNNIMRLFDELIEDTEEEK